MTKLSVFGRVVPLHTVTLGALTVYVLASIPMQGADGTAWYTVMLNSALLAFSAALVAKARSQPWLHEAWCLLAAVLLKSAMHVTALLY